MWESELHLVVAGLGQELWGWRGAVSFERCLGGGPDRAI